MKHGTFLGLIMLTTITAGCDTAKLTQLSGQKADLKEIYGRAATTPSPERNAIVFIHGVLGAQLQDPVSKCEVWGAFEGNWANPATPEGARLLALPMKTGVPLSDLHGTVQPVGLLRVMTAGLADLPVSIGAYDDIARALRLGEFDPNNYAVEIPTFSFFYDWRLSNADNARRLHVFLQEKRVVMQKYVEKRFGLKDHDVKFDLIAHSMGGMVTRYYLRYGDAPLPADGSLPKLTWAGAEHVEKVIIVGTPNAGFVGSQLVLVNGLNFVPLFSPKYPSAVMGTQPSWYEMLTRVPQKCVVYADRPDVPVDIYDVEVWKQMGWGLADPKQDKVLAWLLPDVSSPEKRREIALDHLKKCLANAKQFQAALDVPTANRPRQLQMYLFSGDAIQTDAVLSANAKTGELKVIAQSPGDRVVTRASCLMDERVGGTWHPTLESPVDWEEAIFLRTGHMGTTADPTFLDNLGYLILESPRTGRLRSKSQ